jgi:hypothetical protein
MKHFFLICSTIPFLAKNLGAMLKYIIPTPLEKYEFVNWDHHPNYWGKSKSCSKPPTSVASLKMVIFHSYVSLPEGITSTTLFQP